METCRTHERDKNLRFTIPPVAIREDVSTPRRKSIGRGRKALDICVFDVATLPFYPVCATTTGGMGESPWRYQAQIPQEDLE